MSVVRAPLGVHPAPTTRELLVAGRAALVVLALVHLLTRLDPAAHVGHAVTGVAVVVLAVALAGAARRATRR